MINNLQTLFSKINKSFNKNIGLKELIPLVKNYNGNDCPWFNCFY